MAELPPFGPGRAHRGPTYIYDPVPPRAAIPIFVLRACAAPSQECSGPGARAVPVRIRTSTGIWCPCTCFLRLAAPTPVARSFGLAGPMRACDMPVQAPGPGRFEFQHRALAGSGAQGTLKIKLVRMHAQCQPAVASGLHTEICSSSRSRHGSRSGAQWRKV